MEPRARTSSDPRDLLAGSATIAAMLVVGGAAKSGYGVRGLGITALSCMLYQAGKYVLAGIRALPLREPSTRSLWPFRSNGNPKIKSLKLIRKTKVVSTPVGVG